MPTTNDELPEDPMIPTNTEIKKVRWTRMAVDGQIDEPHYQHDAGMDLHVSEGMTIQPGQYCLVPCGIRIALPDGVSAIMLPRSSTVKRNLLVFSTLIDSGFRGDLFVFTFNLNHEAITLEPGDRIAQLLPIVNVADHLQLEEVPQSLLPSSERGVKGFGSSGR